MPVTTTTQQIRYSTVRITTNLATGTGFLYNARPNEIVLVTNKHVVADASTGRVGMVLSRNDEPTTDSIAVPLPSTVRFEDLWHGHPDPDIDVTVMPLEEHLQDMAAGGKTPFLRSIPGNICPTPEQVATFDALETITFVGYPDGLIDTVHHTPIMRRGITATPIAEDWCGKPQMLIDASVFLGSSGSPVFLIREEEGVRLIPRGPAGRRTTHFLGIVASVFQQSDTGEIVKVLRPRRRFVRRRRRAKFDQMIDLGIVYKWPTIEEAIDDMYKVRGLQRRSVTYENQTAATPSTP